MAACAYDTAGSICEERPAVSEAGRRIKTSEKERRKHLWNRRDCNRQTLKVHGDIGRGYGEGYDEKEIHLDKLEDFRIYLDQSTAEIFLNQGEKVLTMKSYFTEDTLIHMNSELQIKVKTWLLEEE